MIRSTVGLEVVYANLAAFVQVPAWLGEHRLGVASAALGLSAEKVVATLGGIFVETPFRRLRCGDRKLVKVECGQARRDQIRLICCMAEVVLGRYGKLFSVVQAWVEECAFPMQFQVCHESVPVGDCPPRTCPRVQIDA